MEPTRIIYWNAPVGMLVDVIGILVTLFFFYGLYRRAKLWRMGQADDRLKDWQSRIWPFIKTTVAEIVFHRRQFRNPYPGIMHFLIFGGMTILLIVTASVIVHEFTPLHFLTGAVYLWFSLIADLAGLAVLAGLAMAAFRRYVTKPSRLDNVTDDGMVLTFVFLIVVTGFMVEGLRMAENELVQHPDWAMWSPVGLLFAKLFAGLDSSGRLLAHAIMWWVHPLTFFATVVYTTVRFSKFNHIVLGFVTAFARTIRPRGVPSKIDFEDEDIERLGISDIRDFTWKDLLEADTCTRCGRCQDLCPAHLTTKPLSPKKLVQSIKTGMVENLANPTEGDGRSLIGDLITEEEIWACNLCGNCEEACPVFVEHPNKIIGLRRNLVLEQGSMPETAQACLTSIGRRGHPCQGTTHSRSDWMSGLDIPLAEEGGDPGVLFWVGCMGALQDRNIKATIAFARLMQIAGVRFSVLGEQENCCGHFARRLGDELLFSTLAEGNIEVLKACNVKKIVTMCPHGYHTIKNEYPQFDGSFEVIHHSEMIAQFLREGKLRLNGAAARRITYQDPCYLGRFNNLYGPPRNVLNDLPNINLVEMQHHKNNALCCGAGGGRLWMDETPEERVNTYRFKEAVDNNAEAIVAACPLCLQMSEEALKTLGKEESVPAMDLAELVEACLSVPADEDKNSVDHHSST